MNEDMYKSDGMYFQDIPKKYGKCDFKEKKLGDTEYHFLRPEQQKVEEYKFQPQMDMFYTM
jgi:hypothetical protein